MNKKYKKILWLIFVLFIIITFFKKSAQAVTIDGNLADFGISTSSVKNANTSFSGGLNHNSSRYYDATTQGHLRNYNNTAYLGYGGQAYDAEGLYMQSDGTNLYGYMVTGFNMGDQNGFTDGARTNYKAGHLMFDLGADASMNGGGWELGLDLFSGKLYRANTYSDPSNYASNTGPNQATGTYAGDATAIVRKGYRTTKTYTKDNRYFNGNYIPQYDRWVVEFQIGLDTLGITATTDLFAYWTMQCGNDDVAFQLNNISGAQTPVPEPQSLILFGMAMVLLAFKVRKNEHSKVNSVV